MSIEVMHKQLSLNQAIKVLFDYYTEELDVYVFSPYDGTGLYIDVIDTGNAYLKETITDWEFDNPDNVASRYPVFRQQGDDVGIFLEVHVMERNDWQIVRANKRQPPLPS